MGTIGGNRLTAVIDELGTVRAEKDILDKREEVLKDELRQLEDGAYEGSAYVLSVSSGTRRALDQKLVREEESEEWWEAHCSKTPFRTLRTTVRKAR